MSFEWGIKDWREDIGEYYDQHFSEEEMEIIYEIIRGNVGMETLREKLKEFFEDSGIPSVPFMDLNTDDGLLDRLEYDIGYVGGKGTRSVYSPN